MVGTASKVIDNTGTVYNSEKEACRVLNLRPATVNDALNKTGIYVGVGKRRGIILKRVNNIEEPEPARLPEGPKVVEKVKTVVEHDPLFEKLKERYSLDELKELAKGEGLSKHRIDYPRINLKGEHHRILVMSDTHIGSVYAPEEWHRSVAEMAREQKVEAILHCGDLVDGLKIGRAGTQIYELDAVGYDAQLKKAIEIFRQYDGFPVYIISGNHDMYFKEFAGANIVEAFANALPNVQYIGHDSADISLGGCIIRLFHGGDGSSYALSYRLQKLVEAINGGHKPNILLCGHVHKFCYILERNIHAISVPAMQAQTSFMRSKKCAAHTGFLIIDFDSTPQGVANLKMNYYPFYA